MTINIKDGEQWKSVKQFFVKEGGTWKEVSNAFINDAGTWKEIYTTTAPDSAPKILTSGIISGPATVGAPLLYDQPSVSGKPTPTVTWDWYSGSSIVAGSVTTYTPVQSDSGKVITVKATATNPLGSATDTSNAVTVKAAPAVVTSGVINGSGTILIELT